MESAEIGENFENAAAARARRAETVLSFTFDDETATDGSGRGNNGTIEGATPVEGRAGRALRFSGGGRQGPEFTVNHHWTSRLPIFGRAMVLADGTLFVAGPPDTLDEEQAFGGIESPEVETRLAAYGAAFAGRGGAGLWAVSAASGERIAEYELEVPPVFDGLVAAEGRLYLAMTDGTVLCMGGS